MSEKVDYAVIAHYEYLDDIIRAVNALRQKGVEAFTVYNPFPCHELEDAVYHGKARSPVRFFTLLGGLTGMFGAFLMTIWMSVDYPMRTSAKELASIPAFVVVGFECTILLGAIFTLLSMFHFSRIPSVTHRPDYRGQFSEGTFGLTVRVNKDEAESLKQELSQFGAREVEVQYVR